MPETNTGPLLKPDDKVQFVESHRPALEDGDCSVTLTQEATALDLTATRDFAFSVAGPRFQLQPSEIASVFPPKGSKGDFQGVLPHVILNRATLPWERLATLEESIAGTVPAGKPVAPTKAPSWLALLVFAEDEIVGRTSIVKASELMTGTVGDHAAPPKNGDSVARLDRTSRDDPDLPVRVIDLPVDFAKAVLPRTRDLEFLTSVRQVNHKDARGLVVANRLPKPEARNIVHLVSLEHQYRLKPGADRRHRWTETHEHWSRGISPGATLRLVSLATWDFFCDADGGDLKTILNGLSVGSLALDLKGLGPSQEAVYGGHLPVEHLRATGARTASWYRGPLQTRYRRVPLDLPVRHPEALLRANPSTGMTEISYAAAWELGRLLALQDTSVSVQLHQWKRQVAHAGHQAAHTDIADELGHHDLPTSPILPPNLSDWFENSLYRLKSVPFDYLVPDPALLPPETMCWFALDPAWMAALADGAFSVGRTSQRQLTEDAALRHALPSIGPRSGLILRSAGVAGWPDLIVDGFEEGGGAHLEPIRYDRVGVDTLLVLFKGHIGRIDIHLHPQAIHFGFDGTAKTGFTKKGQAVDDYHGDADRRVIDIGTLATSRLKVTGSHDFSFRMIEGVPKVSHQFGLQHD